MTEDQILQRCRKGDRGAQQELYARTSERVYRVLLRIVRNPDDALELAQETYIRVFSKIGQFKGDSGLATWVYRIAVNQALQFLRRRKGPERLPEQELAAAAGAGVGQVDGRLDLESALARLPEFERALLVLRYFERMNYAEMAGVLQRPEGTIASGLNRARGLLREGLGESEPLPDEETVRPEHPS